MIQSPGVNQITDKNRKRGYYEIFKDPGAGPLTLKEISSLSLLASEPGSKIIPKVQIFLSFQCTQKHPYVNGNKPSLMIY